MILLKKVKKHLTPGQKEMARSVLLLLFRLLSPLLNLYARFVRTPIRLRRNNLKSKRMLEIGPGDHRIQGFETVNVVYGRDVDYIADASKRLPFVDGTFDVVFASHILEHTPWFRLETTIQEWARVLNKGGSLEVWVPDGYKLCKFIADIEEGHMRTEWHDGWRPFNEENSPIKWANGRILYGVRQDYPSWHTAIITPNLLKKALEHAGLVNVEIMDESDTRGVRHGWINLGVRGRKQ